MSARGQPLEWLAFGMIPPAVTGRPLGAAVTRGVLRGPRAMTRGVLRGRSPPAVTRGVLLRGSPPAVARGVLMLHGGSPPAVAGMARGVYNKYLPAVAGMLGGAVRECLILARTQSLHRLRKTLRRTSTKTLPNGI